MVRRPTASAARDFDPVLADLDSDREHGMHARDVILETRRQMIARAHREAELIAQHLSASRARLELSAKLLNDTAFLEGRFWPRLDQDDRGAR